LKGLLRLVPPKLWKSDDRRCFFPSPPELALPASLLLAWLRRLDEPSEDRRRCCRWGLCLSLGMSPCDAGWMAGPLSTHEMRVLRSTLPTASFEDDLRKIDRWDEFCWFCSGWPLPPPALWADAPSSSTMGRSED